MGPTILLYVLATLTLSFSFHNYYEERIKTLLPTLSKQRHKYGLNFKKIDNYVKPKNNQRPNPEDNYIVPENPATGDFLKPLKVSSSGFNLLTGVKKVPLRVFVLNNEMPKANLKMGRKKPKEYKCKPVEFTTKRPNGKADDDCDGYYYDGKEFKRMRHPKHDGIDDILRMFTRGANKFTGYEKLGDQLGQLQNMSAAHQTCDGIDRRWTCY